MLRERRGEEREEARRGRRRRGENMRDDGEWRGGKEEEEGRKCLKYRRKATTWSGSLLTSIKEVIVRHKVTFLPQDKHCPLSDS